MAELLTREIANEYRQRLKTLPDYGQQDIRERRELRIELQNRCGLSELQALNVLHGYWVQEIIDYCEIAEKRKVDNENMQNKQEHRC